MVNKIDNGSNLRPAIIKANNLLKERSENVSVNNKYSTRAEIDEKGLGSNADNLNRSILDVETFKLNHGLMKDRAEEDKQYLMDIRAVLQKFELDALDTTQASGTDQAKALKGLAALQKALTSRRKDQTSYIGNPSNPRINPVKEDLTLISNVEGGKATNRYTTSTLDYTTVQISSQEIVQKNYVDAGIGQFLAGAMNYFKNEGLSPNYQKCIDDANVVLDAKENEINAAIETIDKAEKANRDEEVQVAESIKEIFKELPVVSAEVFASAFFSLMMLMKIQLTMQKVDQQILDSTVF